MSEHVRPEWRLLRSQSGTELTRLRSVHYCLTQTSAQSQSLYNVFASIICGLLKMYLQSNVLF